MFSLLEAREGVEVTPGLLGYYPNCGEGSKTEKLGFRT